MESPEDFMFPEGWGELAITPQMQEAASKWGWLMRANPEQDRFPDDFDPAILETEQGETKTDLG